MYLGFDFGLKKIGVAVGQPITMTAQPLEIIQVKNKQVEWGRIDKLIATWKPTAMVVGLPYPESDSYAKSLKNVLKQARAFVEQLNNRYDLPIFTINEQLSTREAHALIAEGGYNRKHCEPIDDISAKLILETWMQEQQRNSG